MSVGVPGGDSVVSSTVNSTQRQDWNGTMGTHWVAHEDRYNTALGIHTERFFAEVAFDPADQVLDIGCGCGQTTRMAAVRAREGAALGVDLSAPMLAQARRRAEQEGVGNVRFEEADVQVHDFAGGAYDLAISRYGVMFFDDPVAAFGNVRRALRPGGRLAFLCWQAQEDSVYVEVPRAVLGRHFTLPEPAAPDAPGPYSLADPDRVRDVLGAAGLDEVRLEPVDEPVAAGADVDEAVGFFRSRVWVSELLDGADPETADKAVAELREALAPYETPDGVLLQAPAWLVTARRAG